MASDPVTFLSQTARAEDLKKEVIFGDSEIFPFFEESGRQIFFIIFKRRT